MTYCQRGRELLVELQRSDWLPKYDEEGTRGTINEIFDLFKRMDDMRRMKDARTEAARENEGYDDGDEMRPSGDRGEDFSDPEKVELVYYLSCLQRNSKYLLSYFLHRCSKIRNLRWDAGPVVPERIQRDTLSGRELEYFHKYSEHLQAYNDGLDLDLDLTSNLEPPSDLYVEIIVLEQCGEIQTENGPVSLDIGSMHFLRKADIEHFIRVGKVRMARS
jgi:GINS complex subunit 1